MSTTCRPLPATYVPGFHNEQQLQRMEYRTLGKTGLQVSKISFGAGALCGNYGFELEEGIQTVQQAIKAGINYIDTAPWYGQGRSEEVLGQALKTVPREAYYIATKVGRYELDYPHMFDFSAAKTRASVERSLQLLGLDYVDVIQIHDIEFAPNLDIVLNETLPVLLQLVQQGKARYIGVTGYPLDVLKQCIDRAEGKFDLVLCYTRYTLVDDTLLQYIEYFKAQGLGVVCAAAHAMGLLTNDGPPSWHPASVEQQQLVRQAAALCQQRGVELGKLAMYHTMQLQQASTFLTGMQTRQLLQLNLASMQEGLSAEEQEVLRHLRQNVLNKPFHWEGTELTRYWAAMKQQ